MPTRNGVKPKCRKRISSPWKRASAVALISSMDARGRVGRAAGEIVQDARAAPHTGT